MRVLIPSPLRSYTRDAWVQAQGATVGEVLADLDRQYPGIRFRMIDEQDRMRPHVRFFINERQTFELAQPLAATDELLIVQALSGG
jgi:molybdopterin converting factor small subunit